MAKSSRGGKYGTSKGEKSIVKNHYTFITDEDKALMCPPPRQNAYFQSGNSWNINSKLRNDEMLSESQQKTVDAMDRNMRVLDDDIYVSRYADDDYAKALGIRSDNLYVDIIGKRDLSKLDNLIGGVVQEKGFMSTSYGSNEKNFFKTRPVRLEIKAKKGTKALFSPTGEESEMVLARGTKYKIQGFGFDDETLIIKAETCA